MEILAYIRKVLKQRVQRKAAKRLAKVGGTGPEMHPILSDQMAGNNPD
jgi:hypothetical protein